MPWRETSPMEQRLEFVHEYESGLFTMTELAAEYGLSRTTGYKWLARYAADGARGLGDRSRRPHASPHTTEAAVTKRPMLVARLPGSFDTCVVRSPPLFFPCATSSRKRSLLSARSNTKRRGSDEGSE